MIRVTNDHYINLLQHRRKQIAEDRVIKLLQIDELDREIAKLQLEDSSSCTTASKH